MAAHAVQVMGETAAQETTGPWTASADAGNPQWKQWQTASGSPRRMLAGSQRRRWASSLPQDGWSARLAYTSVHKPDRTRGASLLFPLYSVWDIVNHTTSADHCGWRPTSKPPIMLQRMVRAWSKPGDLVVDPFLGSGSTVIAALRERRDCSGAEFDGGYVDKMVDRIHSLCPASRIDVV